MEITRPYRTHRLFSNYQRSIGHKPSSPPTGERVQIASTILSPVSHVTLRQELSRVTQDPVISEEIREALAQSFKDWGEKYPDWFKGLLGDFETTKDLLFHPPDSHVTAMGSLSTVFKNSVLMAIPTEKLGSSSTAELLKERTPYLADWSRPIDPTNPSDAQMLTNAKKGLEKYGVTDLRVKDWLIEGIGYGTIGKKELKDTLGSPAIQGLFQRLGERPSHKKFPSRVVYTLLTNNQFQVARTLSVEKGAVRSTYRLDVAGRTLHPPVTSVRDMGQGSIGDCYYLALLMDTIREKPDAVSIKPIHQKGKPPGSRYAVMAPGLKTPVEVEVPTNGERGSYGTSDPTFLLPLLEQAFAQHQLDRILSYDPKNPVDRAVGRILSIESVEEGRVETAIRFLSGHDAKELNWEKRDVGQKEELERLKKELQALLEALEGKKQIAYLGSRTNGFKIAERHAYALIGFDPKTEEVTLRNPWGTTNPSAHVMVDGTKYIVKENEGQLGVELSKGVFSYLSAKEGELGDDTPSGWRRLESSLYGEPGKFLFNPDYPSDPTRFHWKADQGENDGVFTLPLNELIRNFRRIWYETDTVHP